MYIFHVNLCTIFQNIKYNDNVNVLSKSNKENKINLDQRSRIKLNAAIEKQNESPNCEGNLAHFLFVQSLRTRPMFTENLYN